MPIDKSHFSNTAKLLHWLIAGLIASQYVLAKLADYAKHQNHTLDQLAILANHKSVGILILVLAFSRLIYRFFHTPPALPAGLPNWQKTASKLSHCFLYSFLFALPISGWLMSSAKAYSVSWFNFFSIPDLISPNEAIALQLKSLHHFLAEALFVIVLIHIAAALKHHFSDKDDTLARMTNKRSLLVFITTTVLAIVSLGRFISQDSNNIQVDIQKNQPISLDHSELPYWEIDYSDSFIKFTGDQAGAPFKGEWQDWSAKLQFHEGLLKESRFHVTINSSSVFSNDQDRDNTIRSSNFFDALKFPSSLYLADNFNITDDGYIANGQLTMKGFSHPATLKFKIIEKDGKKILTGTSELDRLIWNIGTGDWSDTSWVGQKVTVEVRVVALGNSA